MTNYKYRFFALLIAVGFLSSPDSVFAGADSGFYIGGGFGQTNLELEIIDDETEIDFDDDATAYKIFGGYNFGVIPLVDLAIEASYIDFGNAGSGSVDIDLTALNIFGLAGFKLGPVGLFAKAGLVKWDADLSTDSVRDDDSGSDPAYGLGARLQFGSFAVRAEYELFDLADVDDLSLLSASFVYTF